MDSSSDLLNQAVELFQQANSVLFITGAGISADSGLPTYRGVSGLYNHGPTEDGMTIEQALSGPMFRSQPEITWKYMSQIELGARDKHPNIGHEMIAYLEKSKDRVWVLTQNIDGFHRRAGSKNVIEIHGSMWRLRCCSCGETNSVESYEGMSIPPRCGMCQSMLRPDVVLFEEMLPLEAVSNLDREVRRGFDLYVSVGTSSAFPYVVQPIWLAQMQGKPTIEINPAAETEISRMVSVHLQMTAASALSQIGQALGLGPSNRDSP